MDNISYDDAGFLYKLTDSSEGHSGNVRFQLRPGFTFASGNPDGTTDHPTVTLTNKDGNKVNSSAGSNGVTDLEVTGPDDDGWYYVTLVSPYGNTAAPSTTMNAYFLEVHAYPGQYSVVYQDGVTAGKDLNQVDEGRTVVENTMPKYSGTARDTNNGKYYAMEAGDGSYSGGDASDSITVSSTVPTMSRTVTEREISFQGWVLTNADGDPYKWGETSDDGSITIADQVTGETTTVGSGQYPIIQPADLLSLGNLLAASGTGEGDLGTNFTFYLTALWSTPAPPFVYYVTFNYTDPAGQTHERVDATATVEGTGTGPVEFAEGEVTFAGAGDYYVAKRNSFFELEGLGGLSVVFDPAKYSEITDASRDSETTDWKWYKYDDRTGDARKNGSEGDIYKWTGVDKLEIGARETVQYKITVWNYDETGPFTVTDKVPEADAPDDDHRKPMVIEEGNYGISTANDVQGVLSGTETPEEGQPQAGLKVGGTVTWTNVTIEAKNKAEFTFSAVYPIVLHEHNFVNKAELTWGSEPSVTSNPVTVTVYEDWLRIGKVAYDAENNLFAPEQNFRADLSRAS